MQCQCQCRSSTFAFPEVNHTHGAGYARRSWTRSSQTRSTIVQYEYYLIGIWRGARLVALYSNIIIRNNTACGLGDEKIPTTRSSGNSDAFQLILIATAGDIERGGAASLFQVQVVLSYCSICSISVSLPIKVSYRITRRLRAFKFSLIAVLGQIIIPPRGTRGRHQPLEP